MDFSISKITPIKVRGNNVDFSASDITLKKVRGNNVDFSISEIISKKVRENDVEIRRNLVFDASSYYQLRIDIDSTWCACWVVTL